MQTSKSIRTLILIVVFAILYWGQTFRNLVCYQTSLFSYVISVITKI